MEISIYKKEYRRPDVIETFLDLHYNYQLNHLASDLLEEGLSPKQISDAVLKAIKIGKLAGLKIREHFLPVFTDLNKEILNDCKLSKFAYSLVFLNADIDISTVRQWQIKVLKTYLVYNKNRLYRTR